MSTVKIVYGDLDDARKAANKAADYCSDYAKELKKKVTNKISNLKGGSSSYTSSAAGYANKKISELNSKESKLRTFSGKIDTLVREAKQTDKDVKNYLKAEGRDFRDSHDMHVNRVTELFVSFFVSTSNADGFKKWVKDSFHGAFEWMDEKWEDFKYWYKCEGGKYVVKIIAGIVLTALAVVAAIAAWPFMLSALGTMFAAFSAATAWSALVAVAGFVGAVIAAADSVIDTTYNILAAAQFATDPAWAARYDSFSTLSGWLEKNRFGTSGLITDSSSYELARITNGIQSACAIINLIDLGKNAIRLAKKWKSGALWLKSKDAFKIAKDSKDASIWTKAKYMYKAIKTDLGTIKYELGNQYKNWYESHDSIGRETKKFNKATKPIKSIAKFSIKVDENGVIKSAWNAWKGDSIPSKTIKNIKTVFDNFDDLRFTTHTAITKDIYIINSSFRPIVLQHVPPMAAMT